MKQYNILKGVNDHYYIAEGLPKSKYVFNSAKRKEFENASKLMEYISQELEKRKIKYNIDKSVDIDLEELISSLNPKAIFDRIDLFNPK